MFDVSRKPDTHRLVMVAFRSTCHASQRLHTPTCLIPRANVWRRPRAPPLQSPPAAAAPSLALKDTLQGFAQDAWRQHPGLLHGTALNTAVFMLGYPILRKGLTAPGVAHAWVLGAGTWSAFGPAGYALLCIYFVLGTLVWQAAGRDMGTRAKGLRVRV